MSLHPCKARNLKGSSPDRCNLCPAPCASIIELWACVSSTTLGKATMDNVTPGEHSSTQFASSIPVPCSLSLLSPNKLSDTVIEHPIA